MIGGRRPIYYYGCAYHQARGRTVCANDHRARMEEADAVVLNSVRSILTPAAIEYTVDRAISLLAETERERAHAPERLDVEARKLRKELDRFVRAIAGGTAPTSVLAEIARREARLVEIERERAALAVEVPSDFELRRLRRSLREKVAELDRHLRADVPAARQALRKLIPGRIEFRPVVDDGAWGYHLQ